MTTPMTTEEYKAWCVVHGEWPPAQEVLARLPAENKTLRVEVERLRAENDKLRAVLKEITETASDVLERLGAENANLRDDNASLRADVMMLTWNKFKGDL
jgi:predicted RNase H-like nuclease (RuvC/YqgF family)